MYKNNKPKKTQSEGDIEFPKNLNTYLGAKGYTILKSELPIRTQLYIKDKLTIKPYTPGSPVNTVKSFPCYRESSNKLYLPRYFGIEFFGPPKSYKIPDGEAIDLQFNGSLRDYQIPVIDKVVNFLTNIKNNGYNTLH